MTSIPGGVYLAVMEGAEHLRTIPLDSREAWQVGRNPNCPIFINDTTASRHHGIIQCSEAGSYSFVDLGSRNGSYVNGRRVSTPIELSDGDTIVIGKTKLVFRDPDHDGRARVSPPAAGDTLPAFDQQLVSVLVVDIRDYTGLTQSVDPPLLCEMLGGWFASADRVLQKHGSSMQKYIGDAVMATWVHPIGRREHVEILQALRGLSEFVHATAEWQTRFALPVPLRVGAGLNTGIAVLGNPGTRQVRDFTALGDCVNAAFRLESATRDLSTDLVLGSDTFRYLTPGLAGPSPFRTREARLKGFDTPRQVWTISYDELAALLKSLA